VAVAAGRHTVRFVYQPRSFRLGVALALAGIIAGVLALIIERRSATLARS